MILGTGSGLTLPPQILMFSLDRTFIVSPILNEEMAGVLNRRKILWSPGCGSASEISRAEALGAEIVKIFPAQVGDLSLCLPLKDLCPTQIMLHRG